MTDYSELVKALRCCASVCGCKNCERDLYCEPTKMLSDAADAIVALGLDNEDYEHENRRLHGEIEALQAQLPKRGEWILTTETSDDGAVSQHINCSVCGFYWREPKHRKVFKRCPNCGAKMEVQDG